MADQIPSHIEALVRERRRIEAIKALREHTGIGLKEARDRIIAFERQIGLPPDQSQVALKSLVFWLVLIVVGVLIWWASSKLQDR